MRDLPDIPDIEAELRALQRKQPPIAEVIASLRSAADSEALMLAPTIVYGLSDLAPEGMRELSPTWASLPDHFKARALRQLLDASEASFDLGFVAIARHSLNDAAGEVRAAAIDLLWTDESGATLHQLIDIIRDDRSHDARLRAMIALARFVLLGEYGQLAAEDAGLAQKAALETHSDAGAPLELRCRALEAIANSSHEAVPRLIRAAYAVGDDQLRRSAIIAMGRSYSEGWGQILLDELGSRDNEIVYEAAQACGLIELAEAVAPLGELCASDDSEIQQMAIWALGEIGGKRALEALEQIEEALDEGDGAQDLREALEDAIDSASFKLGSTRFNLGLDLD